MKVFIDNVIAHRYINFKSNKKEPSTVAILGSSRGNDSIMKYMNLSSDVAKSIVLSGHNVIHGCGQCGIMGAVYDSAAKYSKKDESGRPKQNLAIVKEPLWGDEDLENCVVVGKAKSEAQRIKMFSDKADSIVIFPGSAATIQEAATLISKNNYSPKEDRKKIILVGHDYFSGLIRQYQDIYKNGLLSDKPQNLFSVVDSKDEILKELN